VRSTATDLRRLGGIARTAELRALGHSPDAIAAHVSAGTLVRVRRGVLCVPETPGDVIRAARVGGAVTGLSAARSAGLWVPPSAALDVVVPRTTSEARDPDSGRRRLAETDGVRVLWRTPRAGAPHPFGTVALETALRHTVQLEERDRALAVIDSAVHLGLLEAPRLPIVLAGLAGAAQICAAVDGRAESGTETVVREALLALGLPVRIQVVIPFATRHHRVDLLVGERLVIECDSESHHGDPLSRRRDLRRDAELGALGYTVLRFDWAQIMYDLDAVVRVVLMQVARGSHLPLAWRG
jgi:very-short-patch-repair endonuclease